MEHPLFDPETLDVEPQELAEALAVQMHHAALEGEWNDYSHLVVQYAQALQLAQRLEDALHEFLWALYVDLNGPSNVAEMPEKLRAEFPAFDVGLGFIAGDVVEHAKQLAEQLHWSEAQVQAALLQLVQQRRVEGMPLEALDVWARLEPYFNATTQDEGSTEDAPAT